MKGFNDITIKTKLQLLTVLSIGAMVIFGWLSFSTISRVKIGGATYNAIGMANDVNGDFQPPSQFIVEPRMLTFQMRQDIADKAKLAGEVNHFRALMDAFESAHVSWNQKVTDPRYREFLPKCYDNAHEYFQIAWDSYIPLLQQGKAAEADAVRTARLDGLYDAHHTAVDDFAAFMSKDIVAEQAGAIAMVSSATFTLLAVGLVAAVVVALLTLFIGTGIIRPLKRTVDVLNEVANGNLDQRIAVAGSDEIAQMGNALNNTVGKLSHIMSAIDSDARVLSSASEELSTTSQQLGATSQQTTTQAAAVSAAAEEVSQNVQTVSTATEEMSASIKEISKNASEAAEVAGSAARLAGTTNATMTKLSESSAEIGNVIKVITSIAEQTNLLALNATIEAARAGEAGKGFAVVANEVKELAKETAKATEDIGAKVEAIQHDAKGAVLAIDEITTVIGRINDIQNTIASAVEEQTGTTNEISRNISETAKGSSDIASNITGVATAAKETEHSAGVSQQAAKELSKVAVRLGGVVSQFKLAASGRESGSSRASH